VVVNPVRALVIAAQATRLRRTIRLLPPAAGPTSGLVGESSAAPLTVAVIGESTAAGCGVENHFDRFAGAFARRVSALSGHPVEWTAIGQFGATARRVRHRLVPLLDHHHDLVVLLAGANDVLSGRPATQWRADLTATLDLLAERAERTIVMGVPPFASFPSLPRTLRRHLAESGRTLDQLAQAACAERERVEWVSSANGEVVVGRDFFASDGFHPSAVGYRRWADVAAESVSGVEIDR
jgi:lysophospholipase L1-like esterase